MTIPARPRSVTPNFSGVSPRATRAILAQMVDLAQLDGELEDDSRLARLSGYTAATVQRAQRLLVDAGVLRWENTHWRLDLEAARLVVLR